MMVTPVPLGSTRHALGSRVHRAWPGVPPGLTGVAPVPQPWEYLGKRVRRSTFVVPTFYIDVTEGASGSGATAYYPHEYAHETVIAAVVATSPVASVSAGWSAVASMTGSGYYAEWYARSSSVEEYPTFGAVLSDDSAGRLTWTDSFGSPDAAPVVVGVTTTSLSGTSLSVTAPSGGTGTWYSSAWFPGLFAPDTGELWWATGDSTPTHLPPWLVQGYGIRGVEVPLGYDTLLTSAGATWPPDDAQDAGLVCALALE